MTPDRIGALARELRGSVSTDPRALARAGRDGSHLSGRPLAVVAPRDVDEVGVLVRWARHERIGLVPRGAGTSLDGESVPRDGAVVVDLSGWTAVREVRAEERWARVDPGVVNRTLQSVLEPLGWFFPPNPGSWATSTIGGHVGTNASGPRSFRYGPTRAWVRGLEAILGTGERVRLGSRAPKRSLGPDLLGLLVGSEGTLGIVTEVTVGLAPLPGVRRGLVVPLPPDVALGRLSAALGSAPGTGLSAIEYLDTECARDLAEDRGAAWPTGAALLLLEVEAADPGEADARQARIARRLESAGVRAPPLVYDDANRLWSERGESGRVLDERFGERIREDIAVPVPAVDALRAAIDRIAAREGVRVFVFAHLGEGSLHPNFVVDPSGPAAARIRDALYAESLRLGGTISGEHGVGALKAPYVARELGPTAVGMLRAVKRACDPDGILNPGKLYPPPEAG
ncbi:MAG TPA: FAD-binding oxidoreductase [Thermoplasmata archaeon]|nr:FAD-binding oxidoreductase [Thermoplasmata archaeon]